MDVVHEILANVSAFASTALAPYPGVLSTVTNNALTSTTTLLLVGTIFCWTNNITTGYWSWVDRCWSTFPAFYAFIYIAFNYSSTNPDNRLYLMGLLVILWGARLTYNFWRKGGYSHLEDYRWPILRKQLKDMDRFHPLGQELFNLFFVAIFQMVIVYFICVPVFEQVYQTHVTNPVPLNMYDGILAVLFLTALGLETYTDEVQWKFQSAKYALSPEQRSKAGGDIALGFCTSGPFAYSRHLNFFCEMSIWYIFYGFTVSSGSALYNYTIVGAFVLSLLFQGSTNMTEKLSIEKYPLYAEYQKTTSRLIPFLPGPKIGSSPTVTKKATSTDSTPATTATPASASKGRRNSRAN